MDREIVLTGKVAYDVENAEWVMWDDPAFVPMEKLFAAINEQLRRRNMPALKVGDEITVTVKRSCRASEKMSGLDPA